MRNPAAAAALALLICDTSWAQQISINFDPAKTEINWTLAGNVHTVHGTFRLKEGRITFDPANGAVSGDLLVDAASGESGNSSRDKRMRNDVLESQRFPEIRLTPKNVEGSVRLRGHSVVRVSGIFLIHGTTHEVTIPIDVSFAGVNVSGSGKFSIPYVEWGMKDPSNFLFKVDKAVDVEIVAGGMVTPR